MDFLIYNNNIQKIHKELKTKLTNIFKGKEVNFHVYEERNTYDILIPDDILLIILNKVGCVKASFVSYQFYTVNRPFVVKCYHLHHYIPIIKNNFDKYTFNAITFDNAPKMYKFKNINVDIPDNLLSLTDNTNVADIIHAFINDSYIQLSINDINIDNAIKGTKYESLQRLIKYEQIFKIILKYQDVITEILKNELTKKPMFDILKHILEQLNDNEQAIISTMIGENIMQGMSLEILLNSLDSHSDQIYKLLFTEEDVTIGYDVWTYKMRHDAFQMTKDDLHFNIDIKSTIFMSHYVFKNKIYNNPYLLPEYKWLEEQLV